MHNFIPFQVREFQHFVNWQLVSEISSILFHFAPGRENADKPQSR